MDNKDFIKVKEGDIVDAYVNEGVVAEVGDGFGDESLQSFAVSLSLEEKIRCLQEIENKLKKILYVYDKSQEPNSNYNYKVYCGGVLIYVSSSNILFGGELVNIVVNLNAIMTNNFSKAQIKRIVFESKNFAQYLATNYKNQLNIQNEQNKQDNFDSNSHSDY